MGNTDKDSVWALVGNVQYRMFSKKQKAELNDILEDMKAVYSVYRPIQVKRIIENISRAMQVSQYPSYTPRSYRKPSSTSPTIDEWDLKNFWIITSQLMEDDATTMEEVRVKHAESEEEIQIALGYIRGIFKNAKIWKGHIDLLRSYKRQLEAGLPLTDRQASTLFKLLSRYSKQVVSNLIL